MAVIRNDRVEILEYLKGSVQRLRDRAITNPSACGTELLPIVEQLAEDAATLEAELIKAGYIPNPTS